MRNIKYLLTIIMSFLLLPILTKAFTSLEISTPNPVRGSTFKVQLDIDYMPSTGKDPEIRDFHIGLKYDTNFFEFKGVTWLQGIYKYREENGIIYIDKDDNNINWSARIAPVIFRFEAKKTGNSNMNLVRNGDSHYRNGDVIAQSLSGIVINVVEPASNTYIGSLGVEGYNLQPTFKKTTTTYNLTVPSSESKVNIIAKSIDNKQTIEGAGEVYLEYGENVFDVVVTAQDGSSRTYTVRIKRPDDRTGDTSLKSISVSDTSIRYKKGVTKYETTVSRSVESVLITARTNDPRATLIGTGRKYLNIGKNEFSISVTSSNNRKTTYTIIVNRSTEELEKVIRSSKLKVLKANGLSLDLSNDKKLFLVGVKGDVVNLPIEAIGESTSADVLITGDKNLQEGLNVVNVKVTEIIKEATEDEEAEEEITEYKIVVYKNPSNAELITNLNKIDTNKDLVYNSSLTSNHNIPSSLIKYLNNNHVLYYNVINMYSGLLYQIKLPNNLEVKDYDMGLTQDANDSYTYHTTLPKDTNVIIYLGDLFEDGTNIKIFSKVEDGKYRLVTDGIEVLNGYIEFKMNGDTTYVFTNRQLVKEEGPLDKILAEYGALIGSIAVIIVIVILYVIILSKYKAKKAAKEPSY